MGGETLGHDDEWIINWKSIIAYLKHYMTLSDTFLVAFKKIKRSRKKSRGFDKLFYKQPNGEVFIIKSEVDVYFESYREGFKRGYKGENSPKKRLSQ
jgi:hypothetical protein